MAIASAIVMMPLILALGARVFSLLHQPSERIGVWLRFLVFSRLIMAGTVAIWWTMWDSNLLAEVRASIDARFADWFAPALTEWLAFFIPPVVGLGLYLIFANIVSAVVLKQRLTLIDVLKLAWWRLVSFAVPLLLIAIAADGVLQGGLLGAIWIVVAGVCSIVGMVFYRRAEGFREHEVKASETRNRALAIAKRMGVKLQRVYVVPAGRGHLTNASAGGSSIFLTDNLGKQLDKREIDSVIAHELGHLISGHTRKKLLQTTAIYAMTTLLLFVFRRSLRQIRPMLEVLVIFAPLAVFYFLSRKHEFEADRREVEFTGDPETAIRALAGIYALSAAPIRYSRFAEILSTHPSFERRARAMARWGEMPAERVSEILRREDVK
jgi:Zn-dependent protease with chaperone function